MLKWNLNENSLSIDLKEDDLKNRILIKRKILSSAHRVFDLQWVFFSYDIMTKDYASRMLEIKSH